MLKAPSPEFLILEFLAPGRIDQTVQRLPHLIQNLDLDSRTRALAARLTCMFQLVE